MIHTAAHERRLLLLAAITLLLYTAALTLAPMARTRSLQAPFPWQAWTAFGLWVLVFVLAVHRRQRVLPYSDPYLLPAAALLTGWGTLTITRLLPQLGLRQALWMSAAGCMLMIGLHLPSHLHFLRRYKYLWLTGGLALTALTLALGANPLGYGPRLWLGCCGLYLQPSEPLKLLLIIYLAAYFADRLPAFLLDGGKPAMLPLLFPTLALSGLAIALLIVQRDLGTASIFIFLYAALVYLITGRRQVFLRFGALLPLFGLAGYALFDVVRVRVDAWLNPWADPGGNSYQIVQSLISLANGGLLGRGPGMGSPGLVPVAHSDFIFAAIAEESGLAGALAIILLLALLSLRAMQIAIGASQPYHRYLAAGIGTYFGAQSILIIGGTLRLLPLTGVTLPFVSYGGSSLLTCFLALGLLLHISAHAAAPGDLAIPLDTRQPYLHVAGLLLAGFLAAGALSGWWMLYRAPALLERADNLRRSIAARYMPRGDILTSDDTPLAVTIGQPGAYTRLYLAPALAPVIGYTHPTFGESGLEAGMDEVLRGLQGYPAATLWQYHLLYGTPPPGLGIRISLQPALQSLADDLLGDTAGALVLLNAHSGEIYVMASHPGYDPNALAESWNALRDDPHAPLLNRTTQGQYQAGPAAGALLLGLYLSQNDTLPPLPSRSDYTAQGQRLTCAAAPAANTWSDWLQAGCPGALAALGSGIPWAQAAGWGHGDPLKVRLPAARSGAALPVGNLEDTLGLSSFWVITPLQMALHAAALSNAGTEPSPRLVLARQAPDGSWLALPADALPRQVFTAQGAQRAASLLRVPGQPWWMLRSASPAANEKIYTWVMAGTLNGESDVPLALALVLESPQPERGAEIATRLLSAGVGAP
ncbi:MAG: hypothetical protein Fur0018_16320 [Anaerolineales bacterium]